MPGCARLKKSINEIMPARERKRERVGWLTICTYCGAEGIHAPRLHFPDRALEKPVESKEKVRKEAINQEYA
jgi:hypothetical protein